MHIPVPPDTTLELLLKAQNITDLQNFIIQQSFTPEQLLQGFKRIPSATPWEKLVEAWITTIQQGPVNYDHVIKLAQSFYSGHQYASAQLLYTLSLKDPQLEMSSRKGIIQCIWMGIADPVLVQAEINRLTALNLSDAAFLAHTYNGVGTIYMNELDDYDQAVEYFRQATTLEPDYANYWYNLGLALPYLDDLTAALEAQKKAFALAKNEQDTADILYAMGELACRRYQYQQAQDHYQAALQLDKKMVYGFHSLMLVHRTLGDFTRARSFEKIALELYEAEYENKAFTREPDKYYFYSDLIGSGLSPWSMSTFDKWEQLLLAYLCIDKKDATATAALCKLYYQKRKAMEEGSLPERKYPGEEAIILENAQASMMTWYYRAMALFTEKENLLKGPTKQGTSIYPGASFTCSLNGMTKPSPVLKKLWPSLRKMYDHWKGWG